MHTAFSKVDADPLGLVLRAAISQGDEPGVLPVVDLVPAVAGPTFTMAVLELAVEQVDVDGGVRVEARVAVAGAAPVHEQFVEEAVLRDGEDLAQPCVADLAEAVNKDPALQQSQVADRVGARPGYLDADSVRGRSGWSVDVRAVSRVEWSRRVTRRTRTTPITSGYVQVSPTDHVSGKRRT
jgi:hypothetical protein